MAISASMDFPDGGLDALMQVIVCDQSNSQIGIQAVILLTLIETYIRLLV